MDSSENSTKQLESRLILTRSSSLVWTLSHADSPLCPGVHCRLPLSVSRRQLPSSSFVRLSSRVPLPLPDTARSQVQNPLSGFAPKQTKESSDWRTTYIVLHNNKAIIIIIIINQGKISCHLLDFDVPTDHRVIMKESEKIDKYLDIPTELKNKKMLWNKKMVVTPIIGTVFKDFKIE